MSDKLGSYIQKLMTTILDTEQEKFVVDLAWNELKRINGDIESFLRVKTPEEPEQPEEKPQKSKEKNQSENNKQLLQEEK